MSTFTRIPMPEDGTPEWHEKRRQYVTASECAGVMGLSKWSNPYDLYLLKRGLIEPTEATEQMQWGTAVEHIIRQKFEEKSGFKGYKPDFMAVSNEHPWLAANLDWIREGDNPEEGAELKLSDNTKDWGESWTQDCPVPYFIQVQQQLLVTGFKTIYLFVRLPYSDYRIYPITPDADVQKRIVEVTHDFWFNYVKAGNEPPATNPETVKKMFPTVVDEAVELPATALELVQQHKDAKETMEAAKERADAAQARLMQMLGPAKKGKVEGWAGSISRSETKESTYTATRKAGVTCRINHPRS